MNMLPAMMTQKRAGKFPCYFHPVPQHQLFKTVQKTALTETPPMVSLHQEYAYVVKSWKTMEIVIALQRPIAVERIYNAQEQQVPSKKLMPAMCSRFIVG